MIVFWGLNCLFVEADSKYELENIDFQIKMIKNLNLLFLNHTVHCMHRGLRTVEIHQMSLFLASKSYKNMNFDQIKSLDINLMMIDLTFHQNCNFLATHVDAKS